MKSADPIVFLIDDDPSVREAISSLIRSVGLPIETFPSAQDFMQHWHADAPACLVLDVRLPGLSGLDLQRKLTNEGEQIPIIFITGHGDIPMSVRAMKAGAVEFLSKPFHEQDLLDAIWQALARDEVTRQRRGELAALRKRYDSLTFREREVMPRIVGGMLNKQVAAELGISEITIKVHRRHIMQKLAAKSLADLVRIAEKLV